MRLMQLARQLGVEQKEIVALLTKNDIVINNKSNEKVEDDHLALVYDHFPSSTEQKEPTILFSVDELPAISEPVSESITSGDQTVDLADEKSSEKESVEIKPPVEVESSEDIVRHEIHIDDLETEAVKPGITVIKAKKIKLEGIKVLGKIDLPEPGQKSKDRVESDQEQQKTSERNQRQRRNKKVPRSGRQPETFDQKQKRLERVEKRKRELNLKKIKEKKRKHYEAGVLTKQTTKSRKKAKSTPAPAPVLKPKKAVRYKNPIRRFWGWLNGEFD